MSKKRILIAEDDVLISEQLSDILTNYGYEVIGIAANFKEAVKLIDTRSPDLALLDIKMQGKEQGFEIAAYLNRETVVPFLFLTSYSDTNTLAKASNLVPASYLTKPFSKEQVFSAVNIALNAQQEPKNQVLIKSGVKTFKVKIDEILWVKAEGVYVELKTKDRKILLRSSLKAFLENYPKTNLTRIHRTYAVNITNADSVSNSKIHFGREALPIANAYKEETTELFKKGNG